MQEAAEHKEAAVPTSHRAKPRAAEDEGLQEIQMQDHFQQPFFTPQLRLVCAKHLQRASSLQIPEAGVEALGVSMRIKIQDTARWQISAAQSQAKSLGWSFFRSRAGAQASKSASKQANIILKGWNRFFRRAGKKKPQWMADIQEEVARNSVKETEARAIKRSDADAHIYIYICAHPPPPQ